MGEALRAIEEYLKLIDPTDASSIEKLRYRFYDIEHQLAFALRAGGGDACGLAAVRLYVLITESACKLPWLRAAEEAIRKIRKGMEQEFPQERREERKKGGKEGKEGNEIKKRT